MFLLSHRTWCRELRWNLQGAGEGQSWSSACIQGARAVALAVSGKRGPHRPPGLAFPFLGSCISPPPTWAGRGWSKHPHLCLPQLELPSPGLLPEALRSTLPWAVPSAHPPSPGLEGLLMDGRAGVRKGLDSQLSVSHAEAQMISILTRVSFTHNLLLLLPFLAPSFFYFSFWVYSISFRGSESALQ